MTSSIRTVIFDFDGTLHDSLVIYARAFQDAWNNLAAAGHVVPRTFSQKECRSFIGLSYRELWSGLLPDTPEEVWLPQATLIGEKMVRLIADGTAKLYPGIPAVLDRLHKDGYTLVILSNCRSAYRDAARKRFGLDRWCSDFFAGEAYDFIPKEEIFQRFIAPAYPGDYVFVGDRHKDIAAAFAAGMPCVGCTYGYGTAEELTRATVLVDTPDRIADAIEALP